MAFIDDGDNLLLRKIAGSLCSLQSVNVHVELRASFEGDSIVQSALPTWPDYLGEYSPLFLTGGPHVINYGIDGGRVSSMVGEYAAGAHTNRLLKDTDNAWFFLHAGGNDLTNGDSPDSVYENLKFLWALARSDKYKVVAVTILPRFSMLFEEINQMIGSIPELYDVLVPAHLLFIPHIGDATYLYDGVHPTKYGARLIAQEVASKIAA